MNLTSCIKVVELRVSLVTTPGAWLNEYWWQFPPPGEVAWIPSAVVKAITYSRVSRKHLVFWSCVVGLIARHIGRETKAILRTQRENHFFKLVVNIGVWVIEVLKALDTDLCKIESNRDPPKIFIPIPKIESNGCARSDSLLLA
ncbi:MAG: hypothetical protein WCF82_07430 [Microcoleus sp.]